MEKLTKEQIVDLINNWATSEEYRRLKLYKSYYEVDNKLLQNRVNDRRRRGKTPNNSVPTAYYTTVTDSMAGYMFNDVKYTSEGEYNELFNSLMVSNNADIKDMAAGVYSLAYNKACELVYTDEEANPKFSTLDPLSVIPVYTDDIEPILFCGIWFRQKDNRTLFVDVIYADEWQQYLKVDSNLTEYVSDDSGSFTRELFFSECPIVIYKTQVIGEKAPFHQVLPYVNALDWLITGNSNEIDRLVDALLVLGKNLKQEDLDKMDEWKALQGMKADDRAEYLTKDMSPAFREYVSNLLIQEIHKHSHVVDWYNPETGLSGAASGKALKSRMFDMDMYSKRIEKIYKEGTEKRTKLIGEINQKLGISVEPVKVTYNRDMLNDFEEKIVALNQAMFLSTRTKVEEAGFNWEEEQERLDQDRQDFSDNATTEPFIGE